MASNDLVAKWLARLGRAVSATIPDEQAQRWFETIAPMLAGRFPDAAFTLTSLEAVAANCRYLPAYAELVEHLSAWWRDNRPPAIAITHQPDATADWATEQRAASWRHITADEVRAKIRMLDGHPMRIDCGRLLAKALEINAPHLRPMLPPEFLAEAKHASATIHPIQPKSSSDAKFQATHGRKPGELTPNQINELRKQHGPKPAA